MNAENDAVTLILTPHPLDPQAALVAVQSPRHGAMATFFGAVRDHQDGRTVVGVSYDVFEPLAMTTFEAIAQEARRQGGDAMKIYIAHRYGRLAVGELSVAIAVGAPHRREALAACRFIIEEIKHRSPIWKQEHYTDGDNEWVQGHAQRV